MAGSKEVSQDFDHFYLQGFFPAKWLVDASKKGKRALCAALIVWHAKCRKRGRKTGLIIHNTALKQWEISRRDFQKGLKHIEQLGLVKVTRSSTKQLRIDLIYEDRKPKSDALGPSANSPQSAAA
jgi:hypothetical protein